MTPRPWWQSVALALLALAFGVAVRAGWKA